MAKCKHRLQVELKWTIDHSDGNIYKKFLDSYLCSQLHEIQRRAETTGMRQTSYGGIMRDRGEGRNIDIFFDQKTTEPGWIDGDVDRKQRSYQRLINAVVAIDQLVGEIPEDARPSAVVSLKNYRTPWVQPTIQGDHLLMRNGFAAYGLPKEQYPNVKAEHVCFYGEPRAARKAFQAFKVESRNKGHCFEVGSIVEAVADEQFNDNWICVWYEGGKRYTWSPASYTRMPVGMTGTTNVKPIKHLTLKYPSRGQLFADTTWVAI